ncbi:hypothetical protein XVE_3870 [Xanthomonas vesicatoria ATCC 35937]|uniref:Uncharacterized protein n=1 Tax=Xanthomonas vesicatoria ATCC 35937 TaxID=925775 RepID=F0BHX1_9XANT|nr:hypothetical protein XVE_3870 [Xanthomonas vesicatoria ATCC 35937]
MTAFPGARIGVLACVMHDRAPQMNLRSTLHQPDEDMANTACTSTTSCILLPISLQ